TGASNPALKSIFDRFSEITGMDIIAAMAVTGADDVYTGTPVENGNGDNGGNENGGGGNVDTDDSARNWALAEDLQKSYLGEDGPLFTSSGSVANITKEENNCWIDLRGVTEAEVVAYVEALIRAGFEPASTDGHFNKEVDGKSLTVVLSGGEDDELILHLSLSEIEGDKTDGDGKTDGGNGGNGGNGGESGGGNGGNGGKEEPKGDPDDDAPQTPTTMTIDVCYVTKGSITDRDVRTCLVGDVIADVTSFFGGEAYYDQSGTQPLPEYLVASADLRVVYVVRADIPSEVRVYIVDVYADGSESAYASVPVNYGSDYSFRYYEYVLFEDAACTKAIDPNVPRTLTEDVTVYRRDAMQEVYLYIPARFFINDFDATFSTASWCDYLTIRRGKIFEDEEHFGVYPFRDNGTHYYDAGKSSPLFTEKGNCVYFDESNSDVRIFAYLYDPKYQEVTYKCGETVLTKALLYEGDTLGWGSIDYYGYWIENPVLEGNVVKVDSYTRLNRITVKHVINGKVVGESRMYFKVGDYEIYEEEEYYSDATLSTPYYGKPTGDMTLYKDFTPRESAD
ncbi:MAG: hypothetical protein IJT69_00190, partial [Clostridia bacterium]|nr:hypothetical protein [Clostridia bacterium]